MLEQLFGSKIRVKLLRLFLANPNKKYFLRELARILGAQINSVRREVENLASLGILKEVLSAKSDEAGEDEKGDNIQKKYFQADKEFPLFSELKSLVLRAHLIIKSGILREIMDEGNIYYLVLTGLFVNTDDSSTDILIVGKVKKERIEKIVNKFEKDLDRSINYTIMPRSEFNYRREITDRFLYNILEGEKIVIIDKIS